MTEVFNNLGLVVVAGTTTVLLELFYLITLSRDEVILFSALAGGLVAYLSQLALKQLVLSRKMGFLSSDFLAFRLPVSSSTISTPSSNTSITVGDLTFELLNLTSLCITLASKLRTSLL